MDDSTGEVPVPEGVQPPPPAPPDMPLPDLRVHAQCDRRFLLDLMLHGLDGCGITAAPIRAYLSGGRGNQQLVATIVQNGHSAAQLTPRLITQALSPAIAGTQAFAHSAYICCAGAALLLQGEDFAEVARAGCYALIALVQQFGGDFVEYGLRLHQACGARAADAAAPVKPGRNQPCPCGSGKKHKLCCGRTS